MVRSGLKRFRFSGDLFRFLVVTFRPTRAYLLVLARLMVRI